MKPFICILALSWGGLWFTPDQQGQRAFDRGDYAAAAEAFQDPMWQGAAWFKAGEFEQAAQSFSRRSSAEGYYNRGNALVFLGKYEAAVDSYTRALEKRPGWSDALENRELAASRAEFLNKEGGDMTGGKLGEDGFVFNDNPKSEGEEEEVVGAEALSDAEIQALWLRRVQSRPADFLKAKFTYQRAMQNEREGDE